MLLKTIKGFTFQLEDKEYDMRLVDAMDKFYHMLQTEKMIKTQFCNKFNKLIQRDTILHSLICFQSIKIRNQTIGKK